MIKFLFSLALLSHFAFAAEFLNQQESEVFIRKYFKQHIERLETNQIQFKEVYELIQAMRVLNDPVVKLDSSAMSTLVLSLSRQIAFLLERSNDLEYLAIVTDMDAGLEFEFEPRTDLSLKHTLFYMTSLLIIKTFNDEEFGQLTQTFNRFYGPINSGLEHIEDACSRKFLIVPKFIGSGTLYNLVSLKRFFEHLPNLRKQINHLKI